MNKFVKSLTAISGAILLAVSAAEAQVITNVGTTTLPYSNYPASIGLQYVVGSQPILISQLGIFVTNGTTGIRGDSVVDLWLTTDNDPDATTGTLLSSAFFSAGAGAGQADKSFDYLSLTTPEYLAPGTVFILTRTGGSDWENNDSMTGLTLGSDVTFSGANPSRIVVGDGSNPTFPVGNFPNGHAEIYITSNAEFAVVPAIPEPSSVVLGLISGVALLGFAGIKRARA